MTKESLTPAQIMHLADIEHEFILRVEAKYRKGANEHGGNLFDMSIEGLLENAIDETIDQFTYLITMQQKIKNPSL